MKLLDLTTEWKNIVLINSLFVNPIEPEMEGVVFISGA